MRVVDPGLGRVAHGPTAMLQRSRLVRILDEGACGDLTILQAPAGFGKSTLLAEWSALRQRAGDLLNLVELTEQCQAAEDFIDVLGATLTRVVDPGASEPPATLQAGMFRNGDSPVRAMLDAIATIPRRIFLVFDDFERAQSTASEALLQDLLVSKPPNLHITVSSQCRLNLNLSDLRLQGRVRQLGEENLRFTQSETEQLFGATLRAREAAVLHQRCDGWPALIQLTRAWLGQSIAGATAAEVLVGDRSPIADYFMEKIYAALPVNLREFLLDTCVHAVLVPSAGTGAASVANMSQLLRLEERGLAHRTLDGQGFAINSLLRQFFRGLLARSDPDRLRAALLAAVQQARIAGRLVTAVELALDAGEPLLAATIVEQDQALQRYVSEGLGGLRRCLSILPARLVRARPRLQLIDTMLKLKDGLTLEGGQQLDALRSKLPELVTACDDPEGLSADYELVTLLAVLYRENTCSDAFLAQLETSFRATSGRQPYLQALVQAYIALFYQQRGLLDQAELALRRLQKLVSSLDTGWWEMWLALHAAMLNLARGRMRQSEAELGRATRLSRAHESGHPDFEALVGTLAAEAMYELGDIGGAESTLAEALDAVEQAEGWFDHFAAAYVTAARIALARGAIRVALDVCTRAEQVARQRGMRSLDLLIGALRGDVLAQSGDAAAARAAITHAGVSQRCSTPANSRELAWRERDLARLALARCLGLEGQWAAGEAVLEDLRLDAAQSGRRASLVRGLALQSVIRWRQDRIDAAVQTMRAALEAAVEENLIRAVLDAGPDVGSVLKALLERTEPHAKEPEAGFARKLLGLSRGMVSEGSTTDALTSREIEVLVWLERGAPNKIIARELRLTERTVKFHLGNVYRKFGVNSRAAAVAVARRRDLLK